MNIRLKNNDATRLTAHTDSVYIVPPWYLAVRYGGLRTHVGCCCKDKDCKETDEYNTNGKDFEVHVEVKGEVYSVWYRVLN